MVEFNFKQTAPWLGMGQRVDTEYCADAHEELRALQTISNGRLDLTIDCADDDNLDEYDIFCVVPVKGSRWMGRSPAGTTV